MISWIRGTPRSIRRACSSLRKANGGCPRSKKGKNKEDHGAWQRGGLYAAESTVRHSKGHVRAQERSEGLGLYTCDTAYPVQTLTSDPPSKRIDTSIPLLAWRGTSRRSHGKASRTVGLSYAHRVLTNPSMRLVCVLRRFPHQETLYL